MDNIYPTRKLNIILTFLKSCLITKSFNIVVFILVGWLHVEWDNGQLFPYRFGNDGLTEKYDLKVCNEPRIVPENQEIAVGCLVRKGDREIKHKPKFTQHIFLTA